MVENLILCQAQNYAKKMKIHQKKRPKERERERERERENLII